MSCHPRRRAKQTTCETESKTLDLDEYRSRRHGAARCGPRDATPRTPLGPETCDLWQSMSVKLLASTELEETPADTRTKTTSDSIYTQMCDNLERHHEARVSALPVDA